MKIQTFFTDIQKFVEPFINGIMNPCCGDGYYHVSLVKKYGEERVKQGIADYRAKRGRL